ncbi:MAG: hypothetical protein F6K30_29095, partial [Cyanothece sp. SIO2G6]|nr:hypothetical protein [Cyanothece sp. SIO2G6]
RQGLNISDFALVPEIPLTCEFYGFILPEGDRAWKTTVDAFLADSTAENRVFNHWFSPAIAYSLDVTDYCLNQR